MQIIRKNLFCCSSSGDFFMGILVLLCVYVIKVFYDRQAILLENEKLMLENLQSQYQTLKNQVSPHFLFNSLTALTELIGENPVIARQYVSQSSSRSSDIPCRVTITRQYALQMK